MNSRRPLTSQSPKTEEDLRELSPCKSAFPLCSLAEQITRKTETGRGRRSARRSPRISVEIVFARGESANRSGGVCGRDNKWTVERKDEREGRSEMLD